jgi:nucleotide-binding universal stress UspA family protein
MSGSRLINSSTGQPTAGYVCNVKLTEAATELAPSVLVLTDFSEASKEALRWAGHLATHHNANLKVVYPYRLTHLKGNDNLLQVKRDIETQANTSFAKIADGVFKEGKPAYDFKAEIGFINDRVHSYTKKSEVLVVVISKRMASINREALNELLDHLRAPLLVVPSIEGF